MPLFFFIADIFLKEINTPKTFQKNKAESLLKPYLSVSLILITAKYLASKILHTNPSFNILNSTLGAFYATGQTIIWGALWFLPHLFLSIIASWWIVRSSKTIKNNRIFLIFSALAFLFIGSHYIGKASCQNFIASLCAKLTPEITGLPWSIDLLPITAGFILMGYSMKKFAFDFKPSKLITISMAMVFISLLYFFNETIDLNTRLYGNFFITTVQALAGIYLTFSIANVLSKNQTTSQTLSYIGSNTIFILIFHLATLDKIFNTLLSSTYFSTLPLLDGLVSVTLSIAISLLIAEITKRQKLLSFLLTPIKQPSTTKPGEYNDVPQRRA